MAQTRLRFHSIETGVCGARIHQGVSQSQSNNEEERRCAAWSLEGGLGDGDKANKVNRMKKHMRHGTSHVHTHKYCKNVYDFINLAVHSPLAYGGSVELNFSILLILLQKAQFFFILYSPAPNLRPSQSCTCC